MKTEKKESILTDKELQVVKSKILMAQLWTHIPFTKKEIAYIKSIS